MGEKALWLQRHAPAVGALILACAKEAGKGREDQLDLDLDGQWFRIYTDPHDKRVVFFPISNPAELQDDGEEG